MGSILRIYVGMDVGKATGNLRDGQRLSASEVRGVVARELASAGVDAFTAYEGTGIWRGALEPCMVFEAVSTGDIGFDDHKLDEVRTCLGKVATALGQEAILWTVQPLVGGFVAQPEAVTA